MGICWRLRKILEKEEPWEAAGGHADKAVVGSSWNDQHFLIYKR